MLEIRKLAVVVVVMVRAPRLANRLVETEVNRQVESEVNRRVEK